MEVDMVKKNVKESERLWELKEHKIERDKVIKEMGGCPPCGLNCSIPSESLKCPLPATVNRYNDAVLYNCWMDINYDHFNKTARYWLKHGKHKSGCKDHDAILIQKLWDKFINDFVVAMTPESIPIKNTSMKKRGFYSSSGFYPS